MNSLVTGGAGFIGSHLARHCLELGHDVVVLDDLSGGFEDNMPSGVDFCKGSVTDVELIADLFARHRFDYVYHLAAYAAEGLSHFIRRYNYQNNVLGTVNLLNASVNAGTVRRFVFTSSIAVYGAAQSPMTEATTPTPEDPYGVAKYACELDLRAAHEMFGMDYTVFRPHNVYGEHQNIGDRYRNVIGIFMNQIMQGLPMTMFGDGSQTRAFTHIDDVAPIIAPVRRGAGFGERGVSTSGRRRPRRCASWPTSWHACSALSRTSVAWKPAKKWSTPSPAATSCNRSSARKATFRWSKELRGWPPGPRPRGHEPRYRLRLSKC